MKLGLSHETYRWVAFPWMRSDDPEFVGEMQAPIYLRGIAPPPAGELPIDWMVDRVVAHGLSSLAMECGWFQDTDRAHAFRDRMTERNLTYLASASVDLAAAPDEWGSGTFDPARGSRRMPTFDMSQATAMRTGWTGGAPFDIALRAMELARAAGARVLSLVHGQPGRPNHYTKDPNIDEQIDRMIRNLGTLLPIADEMGLTLATENHMDYRCSEFALVHEGLGSTTLRHVFDFADSMAVNEDPLDGVRHVARHTVGTHLRDMRAQPITRVATGAFYHAPIGLGSVPIQTMLAILQAEAPNPEDLHHYVEVVPRPDYDTEHWLTASLDWLRTECAAYWS
ncbi:MAG: TIM barrel protein [Chloroflexi bacterium]|nr:TIM barrel protein [Chloroflexota bacterium]